MNTRTSRRLGAVLLATLFASLPARANLQSTFDAGDEGWLAVDDGTHDYTSAWQAAGGNPGGFLLGHERPALGGDAYFVAPPSWLGDWSQYLGGKVAYDLKVIEGTSYYPWPDIQIFNGTQSVSWTSGANPVGHGWVNYSVTLSAANFKGDDLATVLSHVTAFRIRGEVIDGPEQEGFDNVSLTAAVPEPESYAMFLAGLGVLGALARRQGGGPARG
ncbi:MAG TPA: laminin B domain-containing protein [Rhodocyclaceae bacterium]|nr:laminin B domain-containing protein [Rhodocyclaceae bacterium]HNH35524.1 laminin B domain-containing protein [Rhodocyclaceae bacterium]